MCSNRKEERTACKPVLISLNGVLVVSPESHLVVAFQPLLAPSEKILKSPFSATPSSVLLDNGRCVGSVTIPTLILRHFGYYGSIAWAVSSLKSLPKTPNKSNRVEQSRVDRRACDNGESAADWAQIHGIPWDPENSRFWEARFKLLKAGSNYQCAGWIEINYQKKSYFFQGIGTARQSLKWSEVIGTALKIKTSIFLRRIIRSMDHLWSLAVTSDQNMHCQAI